MFAPPRAGILAGPLLVLVLVGACSATPERPGVGSGAPATSASSTQGPTETPSDPPTSDPAPAFAASIARIGPRLRERMRFTHREGCPVGLRDLRYLRVGFVDFHGSARTGEIVVHASQARAVVAVFRRLYAAGWPIRRMRLVDDYRGDDAGSMAANNTSGFNCRLVASGARWSEHSYGRAIDVNPLQNPYVTVSSVDPAEGREYAELDRSAKGSRRPGVIREADVVVRAFARIGWEWGGDWVNSKDYQHFSLSGR